MLSSCFCYLKNSYNLTELVNIMQKYYCEITMNPNFGKNTKRYKIGRF